MKRGARSGLVATLVLCLGVSEAASAKTFMMSGEWLLGKPVVLPINGGIALCAGGASSGCVNFVQPIGGGVPGIAVLSGMGAAPASFTIPPHAFGQANGLQQYGVASITSVVQLATSFVYDGPADITQAAAAVPNLALAQPAVFQKNAWSKDPAQTGGASARAAADFSWCPGVGGPNCPSGLAATPTLVQGIVRYTAGPNAFGGTMSMLVSGQGRASVIVGHITTGSSMIPLMVNPSPLRRERSRS